MVRGLASAGDDTDGVPCVEGEDALVIAVGVVVEKENVTGVCAGKSWEGRKRGGRLVLLGAEGEMGAVCVGRKKKCGDRRAMRAASMMALDEDSSSGEEEAVWEAVVSRA